MSETSGWREQLGVEHLIRPGATNYEQFTVFDLLPSVTAALSRHTRLW